MSALRTLGFHSSSLAPVKSFIDKHLTNHTCTTCRGYSRLDNTNKYALITPAFGFKLHGKSNKNDQKVISDLTTWKRTGGWGGVSILRHVDIQLDCYHNVTNVPKTVHVGIDGDGLVDKLHIDGIINPSCSLTKMPVGKQLSMMIWAGADKLPTTRVPVVWTVQPDGSIFTDAPADQHSPSSTTITMTLGDPEWELKVEDQTSGTSYYGLTIGSGMSGGCRHGMCTVSYTSCLASAKACLCNWFGGEASGAECVLSPTATTQYGDCVTFYLNTAKSPNPAYSTLPYNGSVTLYNLKKAP